MSTPPRITDSHCHLDFPDFEGELPDILARAADAGVHRMVTICTRLRLEPSVRALAEAHPQVFYAAGTACDVGRAHSPYRAPQNGRHW
jgi:TatD DNase family protein